MADEGFLIGGRTYPFPTSFRLCDPVLVTQLTGMTWMEFVELLEDTDAQDPATMAGMIGVAVWQAHPKWQRDRVVRFVEQLDMGAVDVQGGDAEPAADDDDPTVAAAEPVSSSSAVASNPDPVFLSEPSPTLLSTGVRPSVTTSPESLQSV